MSFPDDLLEQARHLLTVKGALEQVNLRRAVSASYYALFHLLTSSASSHFTGDARLSARVSRSFSHTTIRNVSEGVVKNTPWWVQSITEIAPSFAGSSELKKLKFVAENFVILQNMRHDADYNLDPYLVYSPDETRDTINNRAQEALDRWREIEKTDLARLYLASFFYSKPWS